MNLEFEIILYYVHWINFSNYRGVGRWFGKGVLYRSIGKGSIKLSLAM